MDYHQLRDRVTFNGDLSTLICYPPFSIAIYCIILTWVSQVRPSSVAEYFQSHRHSPGRFTPASTHLHINRNPPTPQALNPSTYQATTRRNPITRATIDVTCTVNLLAHRLRPNHHRSTRLPPLNLPLVRCPGREPGTNDDRLKPSPTLPSPSHNHRPKMHRTTLASPSFLNSTKFGSLAVDCHQDV